MNITVQGKLRTVHMEPAGDVFPDTDGHLRFSTQSQVDQLGARRGNNREQGSLRGTGGIS